MKVFLFHLIILLCKLNFLLKIELDIQMAFESTFKKFIIPTYISKKHDWTVLAQKKSIKCMAISFNDDQIYVVEKRL